MHFEHAGMNVADPVAMAHWYVANLGLRIVVEQDTSPYMHFLADATGRVIFELYSNPSAPLPDYAHQDPLVLHLAFAVDDMDITKDRLLAAGATQISDNTQPNGTRLAMLRDPWGVALQLAARGVPLGS